MPLTFSFANNTQLKVHLQNLPNDDLLALLADLYTLNAESRRYLDARFLATTPEERADPYRRFIERFFEPNDVDSLDLDAAHAVLAEFAQTGADTVAQIDLSLYYLEVGVAWMSARGFIYEAAVGNSLTEVYERATSALAAFDNPTLNALLQPKLIKVVQGMEMIDWGLYEYFMDIYVNCFDDTHDDEDG